LYKGFLLPRRNNILEHEALSEQMEAEPAVSPEEFGSYPSGMKARIIDCFNEFYRAKQLRRETRKIMDMVSALKNKAEQLEDLAAEKRHMATKLLIDLEKKGKHTFQE
jgi:hypothetical protein